MDNIRITDLQLGDGFVTLELHRYKNNVGLNVEKNDSDWEVVIVK